MFGKFVISLDFELMWGLYDSAGPQRARPSVLGARAAIPKMLQRFRAADVGCTWATVGLLFCRDKEQMISELQGLAPEQDASGHYVRLMHYIETQVGRDEIDDPCHFGVELIEQIAAAPRQELATHSFSHYCCLQSGATARQFLDELRAAAALSGIIAGPTSSLVFPRNQVLDSVVDSLPDVGITAWRGNPQALMYNERGHGFAQQLKRGLRLLDAFLPLCRNLDHQPGRDVTSPLNAPASRFLRPWSPTMAVIHPLHTRRIIAEMTRAARCGRDYHLWWHPHNFGLFQQQNLAALDSVLSHYQRLRESHDWGSASLSELAAERLL